jgi:mono/diheme cytochrome c family protein
MTEMMKAQENKWLALPYAAGTALVVAAAIAVIVARPAAATVQFAKDTKLACAACHTDPKGAGPLTAQGEKFKANGNKMPAP